MSIQHYKGIGYHIELIHYGEYAVEISHKDHRGELLYFSVCSSLLVARLEVQDRIDGWLEDLANTVPQGDEKFDDFDDAVQRWLSF